VGQLCRVKARSKPAQRLVPDFGFSGVRPTREETPNIEISPVAGRLSRIRITGVTGNSRAALLPSGFDVEPSTYTMSEDSFGKESRAGVDKLRADSKKFAKRPQAVIRV
jgi:hypothetical protein